MTPSTTSPAPSSSTSSQARWTAGRVFMGIQTLLKLGGGLGAHPQGQSALADAGAVEAGGLEHHVGGVCDDLAVLIRP